MKHLSKILSSTIILIVVLGVFWHWKSVVRPSKTSIAQKPDLLAEYDQAVREEAAAKADAHNPQHYAAAGMAWKGIGDATNDPQWYRESLHIYETGIEQTYHKNSLLIANAAVISISLGDYVKAADYYNIAIDLSPGDTSYYNALITLERTKMHAPPEAVLAIFDRGLSRVVSTGDLYVSRGEYFKSIGRFDDAQKDFDLLFHGGAMSKDSYDQEVADIAQLVAQKKNK